MRSYTEQSFPEQDIRTLIRIQIVVILLFILLKGIRPSVLDSAAPEFIKLFLLSVPNFCEAVAGTLTITAILLWSGYHFLKPLHRLGRHAIYILSVTAAAIYVILQELKIHNLGGENVYDPMDVWFSVAGLGVVYLLLLWLKPGMPKPVKSATFIK